MLAACASQTAPVASAPDSRSAGAPAAAPELVTIDKVPGYRRVVRDGQEYFCKSVRVTGQRARATEICLTRDEIDRLQEINDRYVRDLQQPRQNSSADLSQPQ